MNFLLTLRIATRALGKNKLRAGLTVLGVVIGIAAVTAMVSIGQSLSTLIENQFSMLGTNVIIVMPANMRRGPVMADYTPKLTAKDSLAIALDCPSVLVTSPLIGAQGQIIFGNNNVRPREMFGVGTDFLLVRSWGIQRGGFFSEQDVTSAGKVCVIGQTVVKKVFQTTDPINQTVRIKNIPFTVIGVLEAKGANMVGEDQDDIVLMPFTTVRKRLVGSEFDNVNAIMVSARAASLMSDAKREIEALLSERHRIVPGEARDFIVQDMTEIANMLGIITAAMTLMLSSIAGISLIVGGVGIMNIMLVSVTERTREIGIRMAIGARSSAVRSQFLIESIVLSLTGGTVGIILGIALSLAIPAMLGWPTLVSTMAIVGSVIFSGAVGIFFGYYPARKAAALDPIDALRYE
jgi:putative ABC transport system permease protein